jgi:competence protein ComEC
MRLAPHGLLGAFCAGLACALAAGDAAPWAGAAVAVTGVAACALVARRDARGAVCALGLLCLFAGVAWGGARLAATDPRPAGPAGWVTGTIVADTPAVPDARGGHRLRAVVEHLGGEGTAPVAAGTRLLLSLGPARAAPDVGTRLRVAGRLRPAATRASPAWWTRWLARQGISARLGAVTARPAGRRGGARGLRDRWRMWASRNAGAGLKGDTAALVRGMALGGGSQLSQEAAEAFRDAGIWHLLAVSGQNVTVVALSVLVLLRALGLSHRPSVAVAGIVMIAYCLACDGGASVARAGTVGALALIGELRSSARDRWMLLLGGLAMLLAWQPRSLWDPGLQLSFGAVVGLFAIAPPIARRLRPWMAARVAELAAMSLAAGLATAPIVAAHFGRLSLVGVLVNMVAVPLAAPIVVTALAALAAGAVSAPAGLALAAAAGLGADLLLAISRAASALPGATVAVPGAAVPALIALAIAPLAFAGASRAGAGRDRGGPRMRAGLLCLGAAVAAAWALWPRTPVTAWPQAPAVTVLDVGQGDAILLRGPAGDTALVDTGPPGAPAPVLRALRRHGIRRVDLLVVTHGDADHAGGATAVIETADVRAVVHPPEPADGWGDDMRAALRRAGELRVPAQPVARGDLLRVGPWIARVLSPAGAQPSGAPANDGSVVLDVRARGGPSALMTGDAESPVIAPLRPVPVDLLKVSHHGSDDPGLGALLVRVRPPVAVVSVGEGNRFDHPRPAVLEDLTRAGARTWRTDRHGDITVLRRGGRILVEPQAR